MDNLNRYFSYLRKSSEAEDRQALSLDSQRSELDTIISRESLEIAEVFEESHSAKLRGQRAIFNSMLDRIESGDANAILLWNINRLSRNAGDAGAVIDLMDRGYLLEIKTPNQSFRNNPQDKFLLNLFCSQAKLENDNKGVDVKRGLKKKAELGWRPGNALPGYISTPDKEKGFKTIDVDPVSFAIIKRFFKRLMKEDVSVQKLYIESRDKYKITSSSRKNLLSRSAFYSMFSNPFYYGYFEYPIGSNVWYKGKHKPMIKKHDFIKLQNILARKISPSKPAKPSPLRYMKLFKCGECFMGITGEHRQKIQKNGNIHKYKYYHCSKKSTEIKCSQGAIRQHEIENSIVEILDNIWLPEKFVEWAISRTKKNLIASNNERRNIGETIQHRLKKLDKRQSQLIDMRADEEIDSKAFKLKISGLEKQRQSLESSLAREMRKPKDYLQKLELNLNFAFTAKTRFESGSISVKREIIKTLSSNRYIFDKNAQFKPQPAFLKIQRSREILTTEIPGFEPSFNLSYGLLERIYAQYEELLPQLD